MSANNQPGGPWRGPGPFFRSRLSFPNVPAILSIDPQGDYLTGGVAVTITGLNFRNTASGALPTVLFGDNPATNVVVVSAQTITCTAPAGDDTGVVNVTVTIDSQSSTLEDAFLYFETALSEVSPAYGPLAGGTQVEVRGYNIATGTYQIRFGTTLGTNVVYIDEEHIVVTTPAHAVGFVDVVLETSPGGVEVARLSNGFQFTQLTRGEDIRRQPGITIRDVLNNQPNTCTFTVDGLSNVPQVGEQINIIDELDGDRLLFAGTVQSVDQEYEGQIDQLAWRVTAIDFTWLLNRRRPIGTYYNTSASDIVKDLMGKFSTGFSTAFVQTNLAQISIKFDGSRDFATCMTDICTAIGGGHWFVDYTPAMHFFHVKPPLVKPISPIKPGPGSPLTAAEGARMPNTQSFAAGYYYFRTTFLYSNGTESSLGPASTIVAFDGLHQMDLSSIPVGVNPGGGITVTGRRVYFVRGTGQLQRGWKINDNVTTAVTVFPGFTSAATVTDESHLTVTITLPPPTPPVSQPSSSSTAQAANTGIVGVRPQVVAGAALPGYVFSTGNYNFTLAAVYANGTQSSEGPVSNTIELAEATGPHFTLLPAYNSINGVNPIGYRVFVYHVSGPGGFGYGPAGGVGRFIPVWPSTLGILPYTFATAGTVVAPTAPSGAIATPEIDFGVRPKITTQVRATFTWPNNDGPYLEDTDPPDDVTDDSPFLLRDPQITSSIDISQIRNRVIVLGAATSVTVDAAAGDTEVEISDVSIFNETGGTVMIDGFVLNYFAPSSLDAGQGSLFLESALPGPVLAGAPIRLYLTGEDVDSQNAMGRIELDVNGQPTDGVHEYVVSDTSLTEPQQLYTRLYAELEIFAQPIKRVRYATRDPKTKSGQTVHFDMANPPLQGDFLIQDVQIDQIHDESDQLNPRYIVTATSARFELNDLLLQLFKSADNSQSSTVPTSSRGLIETAITGGPNGSFVTSQTIAGGATDKRVGYVAHHNGSLGGISNMGAISTGAASVISDEVGFWARLSSALASQVCEVRTGLNVNPILNMAQCTWVVRTGSRHDSQRIWVMCSSATSTVDSDSLVNAQACGWRLSSVAGDTSFQPFLNDGDGNGIHLATSNRVSNQFQPNTIYTFQMVFALTSITGAAAAGSGFSVLFYTNGEFVTQLNWATTNVHSLFLGVWSVPQIANARTFDMRSMSYQLPYSFNPAIDTSAADFAQQGTLTGIH